jgi:hypothetical protein
MFSSLTRAVRDAFGRAPQRMVFIDDAIAEDVEILPASELEWCREQMTEIGRRRSAGDGPSVEPVVRRPRPGAVQMADLRIPLLGARRALASLLLPFEAVVTGDPNRPTPTRGIGYGPSPLSAVVIYATDGSDTISALEVSLRGNATETMAVLGAIADLPSPQPLLAADWVSLGLAELADRAAIARFARRNE